MVVQGEAAEEDTAEAGAVAEERWQSQQRERQHDEPEASSTHR